MPTSLGQSVCGGVQPSPSFDAEQHCSRFRKSIEESKFSISTTQHSKTDLVRIRRPVVAERQNVQPRYVFLPLASRPQFPVTQCPRSKTSSRHVSFLNIYKTTIPFPLLVLILNARAFLKLRIQNAHTCFLASGDHSQITTSFMCWQQSSVFGSGLPSSIVVTGSQHPLKNLVCVIEWHLPRGL